jgi:hypothetical protein
MKRIVVLVNGAVSAEEAMGRVCLLPFTDSCGSTEPLEKEIVMSESAKLHFIRQQGFRNAPLRDCGSYYPALMFQPRLIGVLTIIGVVFQSWSFFMVLSAVLWWNAFVPGMNPIDALFNGLIARPNGFPRLTAAPGPRRFAQGMGGAFMLVVALALLSGRSGVAWTFEGLMVAALGALIFGKFCFGSYLYHLLRGESAFANRTLPWVSDD